MNKNMFYENSTIILTSKHKKGDAIAPVFRQILFSEIYTAELDTDTLGTFSGETARTLSALECARRKCAWGMQEYHAKYGIANEGSFGHHPDIPFLPCDHEVLYFIDDHRGFHLSVGTSSEKTNYRSQTIDTMEELRDFSERALFPSHALIIRPNYWDDKKIIFKGLQTTADMQNAFMASQQASADHKVWVETDMRAHLNPSRMAVLSSLAQKLARQLATPCPQCTCPGWGLVGLNRGITCSECENETLLVKEEVFGCQCCDYQVTLPRADGLISADPGHCQYCNP